MLLPRPLYLDRSTYSASLQDVAFWAPYLRTVCARHGHLGTIRGVSATLSGTFPTFRVQLDSRAVVVKLFGTLFGGAEAWEIERHFYRILAERGAEAAFPALLAEGQIFSHSPGHPWPYLVVSEMPGTSWGCVWDETSPKERHAIAVSLGREIRLLHALGPGLESPWRPAALGAGWPGYCRFLATRRARCVHEINARRTLPSRLLAQVPEYLPSVTELVDQSQAPALLLADITGDHVFLEQDHGAWRYRGLIDPGDARVGDPFYELVALHLGAFRGDTSLLKAFLRAYDWPIPADFAARAMAYTLLFEFDALGVPAVQSVTEGAGNLEELADMVWGSPAYWREP